MEHIGKFYTILTVSLGKLKKYCTVPLVIFRYKESNRGIMKHMFVRFHQKIFAVLLCILFSGMTGAKSIEKEKILLKEGEIIHGIDISEPVEVKAFHHEFRQPIDCTMNPGDFLEIIGFNITAIDVYPYHLLLESENETHGIAVRKVSISTGQVRPVVERDMTCPANAYIPLPVECEKNNIEDEVPTANCIKESLGRFFGRPAFYICPNPKNMRVSTTYYCKPVNTITL